MSEKLRFRRINGPFNIMHIFLLICFRHRGVHTRADWLRGFRERNHSFTRSVSETEL